MFAGDPVEIAEARVFTRSVLDGHPEQEAATLVASELATNALAHTASGGEKGWFTVSISARDDGVLVAVDDLGSLGEPTLGEPTSTGEPGPGEPGLCAGPTAEPQTYAGPTAQEPGPGTSAPGGAGPGGEPPAVDPIELLPTSGRGLLLVAMMAKEWGSTRTPQGRRVWAVLPGPDEAGPVDMASRSAEPGLPGIDRAARVDGSLSPGSLPGSVASAGVAGLPGGAGGG